MKIIKDKELMQKVYELRKEGKEFSKIKEITEVSNRKTRIIYLRAVYYNKKGKLFDNEKKIN
jgi:hypothetical protein